MESSSNLFDGCHMKDREPPPVRLLELRNTYKWGGGPDKTIILSAEQHDRARVSVVIAYIRDVHDREFSIRERIGRHGFTFYEIIERCKFDIRVLRMLHDIVLKHDINLIHSHDYKSDLFAYLISGRLWRRRITLVSTAHGWGMVGLRGAFYRRLDLWLMRRFDQLIAVSRARRDELIAARVSESRISMIHNAIDTNVWSPGQSRNDFLAEMVIKQSFPVVGYVGRIMPEKDLVTWLRAAALVAEKYPRARFILVGDGRNGETLDELKNLAARLGIADRVLFPGYRLNLLPFYASFDIFVLTSLGEGLPNSILEAMAMGIPVVAVDVGGVKELVSDGNSGYVLPRGDAYGLSQAILALTDNPKLRAEMGQAGRIKVEQEFSFAQRLRRIEDLYERLVLN
jgi:glycosyltransferase involved in cell wall biosynthesis